MRHGARRGALREELDYFTSGILAGTPPTIITPEESLAAVESIRDTYGKMLSKTSIGDLTAVRR